VSEDENKVVMRAQAKELGLSHYYTGKECSRGHLSIRRTDNSECVECIAVKNKTEKTKMLKKKYAENNAEKIKEKQEKYKKENREKIRQIKRKSAQKCQENRKKYYEDNKTKIIENIKKWRKLNLEKVKQYRDKWSKENADIFLDIRKRYRDSNPEKMRELSSRRRGRLSKAEGSHTADDIRRIFESQNFMCPGCDKDLKNEGYHVDHIMPLFLGGSNWPWNLQILCRSCNSSKGAKHPEDWTPPKRRFKCE
jgi:5-methylcytosine-specific restriction endonuclease McrA